MEQENNISSPLPEGMPPIPTPSSHEIEAAPAAVTAETVPAETIGAQIPSDKEASPAGAGEAPDLDRLIAEAEQRGYLRGRNESIDRLMQLPTTEPAIPHTDPEETLILNNLRPSIWD